MSLLANTPIPIVSVGLSSSLVAGCNLTILKYFERKTGFEPATLTLARLCSTNWATFAYWAGGWYCPNTSYLDDRRLSFKSSPAILITNIQNKFYISKCISTKNIWLRSRGGGIRTPGSLHYAGFQDQSIRPLWHSSIRITLLVILFYPAHQTHHTLHQSYHEGFPTYQ